MRTIQSSNELKTRMATVLGTLLLLAGSGMAQTETKRLIVVSIPDRKLALIEDGEVKKIYPVAVGKTTTPSPAGEFEIVNRVDNPTYYHPGTVIGPGAANPLGTRWIGLNQKGYGIHGTNVPRSIGRAASHGCVRMAKRDLEELFEMVKVGDKVEIRAERDEQMAAIFGGTPDHTVLAQATTDGQ
jgi:lipoprotein-anchoring transpeptidase ErfK/SrfK